MRGTLPTLLLCLSGSLAVEQTGADRLIPVRTSICTIVKNPESFEGRSVSVHGRYDVNWEWGAWVEDEPCHQALAVALANGYTTPAYLSTLYIEKNNAFHTFQQQERQLCGGAALCDFDYIEAEFTGVVVGPRALVTSRTDLSNTLQF